MILIVEFVKTILQDKVSVLLKYLQIFGGDSFETLYMKHMPMWGHIHTHKGSHVQKID